MDSEQPGDIVPSSSKGKNNPRSNKRMEHFRARQSEKTDADNKKIIFNKLYYGFRLQSEAMKSMQIVTTPRSIILPISTRSTGFMVRFLICKFARLGIRTDLQALCNSMYRVSLLQMDVKVMQALANQFSRNIGARECSGIDIGIDFVRALGTLGCYFSPLVNVVSSIGVVKSYGTQYIPRYALLSTTAGMRDYDPTQLSYTNLRSYVEALSNARTPYARRVYFYQHSPIPNARWNVGPLRQRNADGEFVVDENFPVLMNPDEIMPQNYNLEGLREDINVIMDATEIIGRKYEKFVHVGGIDFNAAGNHTQLPSNKVEDLRCKDLEFMGEVPDYSIRTPLTGSIQHYWSPELMSDPEFYLGAIHLLGEQPQHPAEIYNVRTLSVAKQEADIDYTSGLQNLLG